VATFASKTYVIKHIHLLKMSLMFTLTERKSELYSQIFPPILLDDGKYEIGLLRLDTYNSIPNVDETNNAFHFGDGEVAYIPKGTYEVKAVFRLMEMKVKEHHHTFAFETNLNTFKTAIKCSVEIDFSKPNSIGPLLGFHHRILSANIKHDSDVIVDIFRVNIIDVHCNISSGSYTNGIPSHSLYAFSTKVGPGFKIHEVPTDVIYLPVDVKQLDHIYLKIVDQDGNLIDFCEERITVRLHIRKALF
jgi:hypothetical protein